jgi:antitoxin component of MazEF toxin-antitoxin module
VLQRVVEYGDNIVVILPRELAAAAGIDVGTLVETRLEAGCVLVQPVKVVPKLTPENQDFVDRLYEKRRQVFDALGE